jgi:N-acetylneuraminic acid mutarotase
MFTIQSNTGTKYLDVSSSKITVGENTLGNATATATTATTSGTGTNTTTVALTAVNSLANGDVIFIDNAGQDYFTRITAGGGTASLTVDPAVTYENARTVTKYNVQYLGSDGTNFTGATRNQNSFYQGYFLGGVVTGAGSTVYSDANISSVGNLRINTATGVNIQGTNSTAAFLINNSSGQQVINVDTTTNSLKIAQGNLTVSGLSSPQPPALTSSATGGTLAAATYYYQLAAVNANGTTPAVASNPVSVTTTGATSQNTLTWTAVTNATSYKVYRSTDGTTWKVNTVTSGTTSIVDNGTNYSWGTAGSIPTANTSGGNLSVKGSATFANTTNSTNALDVQDATGDSILRVDSADRFIGINSATPVATLDVAASPPAPDFNFGFEDGTVGAFTNSSSLTVNSSNPHSGTYAWGGNCSGSGSLYLTRTLSSAGTISFWAWLNQEFGGDGMFYIDGVNMLTPSQGTHPYALYTFPVSSGTHTFQWYLRWSCGGYFLDDVTVGTNSSNPTAAVFHGGNVGIGTTAPSATLETDGTSIFKATSNVTSTLQIQNATGDSLFNADTTNTQITIGRFVDGSLSAPASPGAAAGANAGGNLLGAAGTTYYYKVSAMTVDGETPLSSEVSINGQGFTKLTAPTAPTVGAPAAGGSVDLGLHSYKVTFVTANGETTGGTTSSQVNVTTGGTQTVPLSAIPVGPTGTTNKRIYRTVAGDTGSYLLVTTISNATTVFNDNVADASLGAAAPASNTATTSTNTATVSWSAVTGATSYRVYRGTASGAETSYQTAASSPFTDTGAAGTALSNTSLAVKGTTALQNVVDSTTAFQVQNAAGSSLFNVDSTNNAISILGNNSGALSAWSTATNTLPAVRSAQSTVTYNGYVYAIGGGDGSNNPQSTVYYAKLNADGSVGSWTSATNTLPAVRNAHSSVVANGYVYVIGGKNTSGISPVNTVYYAKLNADGSVGTWNTASSLPTSIYFQTSVAANGYVYAIGGKDTSNTVQTAVYYAKLNADGSLGSWNTASNPLPLARADHSSVVANGYVYVIGGQNSGGSITATVYYAKLNTDGSVGAWTAAGNSLPVNRYVHTSVVSNGYVYVIGGQDGSTVQSTVYYAKLNSDGTVGAWSTTNTLPSARWIHSSVIANGYIYALGGQDNSNAAQSTVYYASTARLQVGANLDLVGLQGQNIADPGDGSQGSTGGSITAGNITAVGTLQVQGAANFAQSMSVNGNLSVAGSSITLGSTASGEIGAYTSTSSLPSNVQYPGTAVVNGYIYAIGGNDNSSALSSVYYAKLNANGTVGTWSSTTGLPAVRNTAGVATYNGYIYVTGGETIVGCCGGTQTTYYAKVNADGTISSWTTSPVNLPQTLYVNNSVAANGYLYTVGGYNNSNGGAQNTVYYTKLNADGSINNWSSTTITSPRYNSGVVVANGYIYVIGGDANASNNGTNTTYYAALNPSTGAIGSWNTTSTLPDAIQSMGATVVNGYVYTVGGYNSTPNGIKLTYYAKLNANGTVGTWQTSSSQFAQVYYGEGVASANGYIYGVGGNYNLSASAVTYYTSTARVQVSGSLDLVGVNGQDLTSSGGTGGDLTAANGTFVGNLQVQGQGNFTKGLTVGGNFNIATMLYADSTNLTITLGQASATPTLLVLGNKNTSGDPTCTDGAIYYNSNSSQFRACQAGIWTTFGNGLFTSNTNQPTVSNTSAETAFSPTPAPGQSYTLPANYCVPGRIIHISASGTAVSGAADSYDARIRLDNTAGQLLGDDSGYPTSASSRAWSLELTITCMTTGTSGTANVQGRYYSPTGDLYGNTNLITGNVSGNITLNTTVSHAIVVTGDWNTANAANIGTMNQFTVTSEGP